MELYQVNESFLKFAYVLVVDVPNHIDVLGIEVGTTWTNVTRFLK